MNKEQFIVRLKTITINLFSQLDDKDKIYQFGVYTDSEASSLYLMYNTYKNFADNLRSSFLVARTIAGYSRWEMSSWIEIEDEIEELNYFLQNNDLIDKEEIYDWMFQALKEMKNEGVFHEMQDDFILNLYVSDEFIDQRMCERLLELLGKENLKEFRKDMEGKGLTYDAILYLDNILKEQA